MRQVAAILSLACAVGVIALVTFRSFRSGAEVMGLSLHQPAQGCRIAVLIAGTVRRVNLNADRHLLQPLTKANCKVDVFLSLFAGVSKGWKKASDAFEQEPDFESLNRFGIESVIQRRFSMPGSKVVRSKIFEEHNKEPQDIAFIDRDAFWPGKGSLGEAARSNFLMMWKELEELWYQAQSEEHQHGSYSFVMILRDDAYWFQDFNLTKVLDMGGRERLPGNGQAGLLYSMFCDKDRQFGGDSSGIIDYVFLMDRAGAEVFCKSYSRLVWPALFGRKWFTDYENNNAGDGSEHFYLSLAEHSGIQVIEVPLYLIPMQRVGRLHGKLCLHKYCDAKIASKNIPYFHPDMPLCKEN